mmetsp:Transcript_60677/g.130281  ORF Transcript_60677/g.130281 Transcript_60677/m.130281 type:complete len:299 (-) Transcript_60677:99-995(-)
MRGRLFRRGAHGHRWRDFDAADGGIAGIAAAALLLTARRLVQPLHGLRIAAPVGDAHGHALRHGSSHAVRVTIATPKHHLFRPLLKPGRDAGEGLLQLVAVKCCADREGEQGVDLEVAAGPIDISAQGHRGLATTGSVAVRVVPHFRGRVALVRGGGEGVGVGLHHIELGAPLAANLIRIAVVGAVRALSCAREASRGSGRLLDEVEGQVAGATDRREIHIEAERPAEQPELGKLVGRPFLLARIHDAEAGIMLQRQAIAKHATSATGYISRGARKAIYIKRAHAGALAGLRTTNRRC